MKNILILSAMLVLGITLGYTVSGLLKTGTEFPSSFVPSVFANSPKQSPSDRVSMDQIQVYGDKVVLDVKNAQWAQFTDTHSMEPVISSTSNAIEVAPKSESEIKVGDIISYQSEYADGIFIHRVIDIGSDDKGWYTIVKGDNNPSPDPGRIRFKQIKRVVVAIIY
ncbi:MAG: hypothetical protein EPN86_00515 [Nanoarchaeota archaeon]|nr:MAG: hypothetical protein EPN86_00515 [Nanoarchaeota archaeon]